MVELINLKTSNKIQIAIDEQFMNLEFEKKKRNAKHNQSKSNTMLNESKGKKKNKYESIFHMNI